MEEQENLARCACGAAVHLGTAARAGKDPYDIGMADGLDGASRRVPVHDDDLHGIDGSLRAELCNGLIDAPRLVEYRDDDGECRISDVR